ncbi:MAG TPA: helix-turn-helix domain-containing protein [Mycobacteriales bacterium]|nr:helix-turn-helix domain-containing protein [Mycobacteriales bacterium]
MSVDPSAAPVRERGVRSRAGNAMQRTRIAVLDGAVRAVEKHGSRRATMADIAMLAGIAKGTLYNHFRTKEAVYAAAVDAGIRSLAEDCTAAAADDIAEALALAAERLGNHPALRRIAADEPAVLAGLMTISDDPAWLHARESVQTVLAAGRRTTEPAAVELVLRWLVSFVGAPGHAVETQAGQLAAALPSGPGPV